MKKVVILVLFILLLCSCGNEEKREVQSSNCTLMKELVSNGGVLIDVRSEKEYNTYHLDQAISLPYETIGTTIIDKVSNKETIVIVYCQSGRRSKIAAQTLLDKGYKNVYDLGTIENCS